MIVVADTSPLNYLVQIDCDSVLPALYKRVLVPETVLGELSNPGAPASVEGWIRHPPTWLEIRKMRSQSDTELAVLGPGERQAILLALEENADLLLIDDLMGRNLAKRRGLYTTGTLGVLLAAGESRLLDSEIAFRRLKQETSFRVSKIVEQQFLSLVKR